MVWTYSKEAWILVELYMANPNKHLTFYLEAPIVGLEDYAFEVLCWMSLHSPPDPATGLLSSWQAFVLLEMPQPDPTSVLRVNV